MSITEAVRGGRRAAWYPTARSAARFIRSFAWPASASTRTSVLGAANEVGYLRRAFFVEDFFGVFAGGLPLAFAAGFAFFGGTSLCARRAHSASVWGSS